MIVTAFDPGTTHIAWAIVHKNGNTLTIDMLDRAPIGAAVIRGAVADADLVGIEVLPDFIASKARASSLFQTAHTAGFIEGITRATRFWPRDSRSWAPIYHLPANGPGRAASWRGYLTGRERSGDDDVRSALERHYPVLRNMRTNTHQRDALGLATVLALLLPAQLAMHASPLEAP